MAITDYTQRHEVETPEQVVLDYEIAGLGSRALAAVIDLAILLAIVVAEVMLGLFLGIWLGTPAAAVAGLLAFGTMWGYFTLFEGFAAGRTPGKKWLGLRVIRETGHGITFRDAAARNLLRIADFFPPPYLTGALFVAIHPRARRLGDLVAGTVVVRDRPIEAHGRPIPTLATSDLAPLLADDEYRLLRELIARAPSLPPEVRARFAASLAARLASRFPTRPADDLDFLERLAADETSRRRGRLGARTAAAGPASRSGGVAGTTAGAAERMVARKGPRWDAFEALARRASASGLDSLGAEELPEFAAGYREVAADLARARTYRADRFVRARLERLVAAGHNVLYRPDRESWSRIFRYIAIDAPAAVWTTRLHVTVAFLAFFLPAAAGYAALRRSPDLAGQALPATLIERAAEGVASRAEGRGYAEVAAGNRPFVASSIIANNVQVAFTCFAGGIFAAVGSLFLLAFNGLLIGAVSGHYHNVGLLSWLWTFVAGHGVLELFAIWCAGAAGFLLGAAVVRPGRYSRRDALAISGRLAMRLITVVVILLLIAGLIEGFVSTSSAPPPVKVAVSVFSAIALVLWLTCAARRTSATT
ncbi:MAG: stage II sporulation protein M [Gemmatimonadota bacterium]